LARRPVSANSRRGSTVDARAVGKPERRPSGQASRATTAIRYSAESTNPRSPLLAGRGQRKARLQDRRGSTGVSRKNKRIPSAAQPSQETNREECSWTGSFAAPRPADENAAARGKLMLAVTARTQVVLQVMKQGDRRRRTVGKNRAHRAFASFGVRPGEFRAAGQSGNAGCARSAPPWNFAQ